MLGVTGCIAAYKACELARALMRAGVRVKVVMTASATRFVGPATFRALTGQPVTTSLWEDPGDARVHHVSLAEEADLVVLAPCTANVVAKVAHGIADDMLTTTVLASRAPLVIAPAMNTRMWVADATRANLAALRDRGAEVVEPASGELACGEEGPGRLAPVEEIAAACLTALGRARSLAGRRLIVTAGGTQEPIDAVRFIGNRSSGKTGFAIAEEAARRGAEVTLVSAPSALPDPFGVRVVRVGTAEEMRTAVVAGAETADAVVMTAAVADFRPAHPAAGKSPKADAPLRIELERTPDILAELGSARGAGTRPLLVGFAAQTGDPLPAAREKLESKHLDIIVANDVSEPGLGFGSADNRVTLVTRDGEEPLPVMPKTAIARVLLDRVADALVGERGEGRR